MEGLQEVRAEAGKIEEQISYEKHAWKDFDQYQMGAFDRNHIPVFLGIGNHEPLGIVGEVFDAMVAAGAFFVLDSQA